MKILLTIIVTLLLVIACTEMKENAKKYDAKQQKLIETIKLEFDDLPYGISVQTIDGCEYVCLVSNTGSSMCHKENCKNPIHNNLH